MHPRTLGAFAVLAVLELAPTAQAGPGEQLNQVAFHPSNADVIAVRYHNGGDGMFFSSDRGKSWNLMCDAVLFDPVQMNGPDIPIAIAGDGTTLVGGFTGLWRDNGHSCGWSTEPKADGEWIGDITLHPTDPNITFAATSTTTPTGEPLPNGVIRRDAIGAWADVGTKEQELITSLHVVARSGGGLRFVVGAVNGETMPNDGGRRRSNYVTRVSDDEGQTWKEHAFGAADGIVRIEGIDPSNPERIVATINRSQENNQVPGADNDTVLVSTDGGAHYTDYLTITEIGGVAFAPDGRVWIGDLGNPANTAPHGLWFATSLDKPATKLPMADYPVQCLGYQKTTDTLYACQHWSFGSVNLDDGTFNSLFKLTDVKSFVDCAGVDIAAACQMQLCNAYCGTAHFAVAPVCDVYTGPTCGPCAAAVDKGGPESANCGRAAGGQGAGATSGGAGKTGNAGTTSMVGDSGIDAGGTGNGPGTHKSSGCSCAAAGAGSGRPAVLGLAALAAAILLRRRLR